MNQSIKTLRKHPRVYGKTASFQQEHTIDMSLGTAAAISAGILILGAAIGFIAGKLTE